MDAIGASFFGDGITAGSIKAALDEAVDCPSVTMNINSPGGDLYEGVAIYNVIKACGKPVNVNVVGMCASAASLVAMAGKTVTMQLGTTMMVHNAQALVAGYASDCRKMADVLDTVSASAADLYAAKTGLPKDEVLKLMDAETWMNPEEAKEKGFADAISKDKAKVTNMYNLSVFKNAPAELKLEVKTKEVDGEHLTAGDFIWVGDPDKVDSWALPWHFSTEEKTKSHLRDALARFDQEEKIPESQKPEAYAKLVRLCKEHGIEVSKKTAEADEFNSTEIRLRQLQLKKNNN
jgi:ATP-dependent protease ClpP protease subunit